ncbi:MAG: aprataxin-like protein [Claussenomyces sp. TS43310]|nr:MAG: aprataxin-like protein [Claussenomyces sp. TS43310]
MSDESESLQDAITAEEMASTVVPAQSASDKRNAFTTLMSSRPKKTTKDLNGVDTASRQTVFAGRDGLGAYINQPTAFPPSRVIYHNDNFLAIHDLYPKSSVHTLLIPRGPQSLVHPFEAFEDAEFLAGVREEAGKLRSMVAKELRRKYSKYSKQEQARERALNGEDEVPDGGDLPAGRDWEAEVVAGVHAHPSMSHLHVHVMSIDHYSDHLKHRKHYNSFSTPFFVGLEDLPLAEDDARRHPGREGYLNWDFKCWRCGKNFGRKFVRVKEHLAEEFEEWKTE